MKKQLKFLFGFLAFAVFTLASSASYGQSGKPQTSNVTSDANVVSVTKEVVATDDGATIRPLSGKVTYTTYMKAKAGSTWVKKDTGNLTAQTGTDAAAQPTKVVCYPGTNQIKIVLSADCDGCAQVDLSKTCN